ncbi:M23 family metallopeptidase [Agromyces sp. NPDC004153]
MTLAPPFPSTNWSDPFGDWPPWRKDMGLGPHRGLDTNGLLAGTSIRSSGEGQVAWRTHMSDGAAEDTGLGHRIVVFYPSDDVYLGYCHLLQDPGLPVGSTVNPGEAVALLGNSGSSSTAAHLHLTASRQNGDPGSVGVIDPAPFFGGDPLSGQGRQDQGDDEMALIARREDNGNGYYLTPQSVHHFSHGSEFVALRYSIGADKVSGRNEWYGRDDFRILVQASGWDYNAVAGLKPGETLLRDGRVIARQVWPAQWR